VLGNIEIKNKKVRITISENRCRIFIGNIPKDLSKDDFMNQLTTQVLIPLFLLPSNSSLQGEGIANVDFLKDPDNPSRNRGFAFVVYKDHPSADRAKRNLSKPSFHIGKSIHHKLLL
jgi:heterogeneous nuclear ribonucleoprotein R